MSATIRILALVALSVLCVSSAAHADEEVAPFPYVRAAPGGRYYVRLVPQKFNRDKGAGAVYQVGASGDRLLYRTQGWYSFRVYLSYDGRYLVRLGNWPRGHKPSQQHLAVAFYDRGKLLKQYSTAELIKDPSKVQNTVSHYRFDKQVGGFLQGFSHRFAITSIDGIRYVFDATSGKIVSQTK